MASVALNNGKLDIAGGFDENGLPAGDVYVLDPISFDLTIRGKMTRPRGSLGTAGINGFFYTIGGSDGTKAVPFVDKGTP